jgi:translation initiation factor IF-2
MMKQQHESQDFNVIVKADVQGSLTSVLDSLHLIETGGEITLHIVGSGVGSITENDIRLAEGDNTIIYGFNVDLPPAVKRLAAREKVEVRLFRVIYELLDDARHQMETLLAPKIVENEIGALEVKGVFRTTRDEVIAGGEVTTGKIAPGLLVRVKHAGEQIAESEITNLQREKIDVKEAFEGDLCGFSLKTKGKLTLEIGDTLEFFTRETVKRTL